MDFFAPPLRARRESGKPLFRASVVSVQCRTEAEGRIGKKFTNEDFPGRGVLSLGIQSCQAGVYVVYFMASLD